MTGFWLVAFLAQWLLLIMLGILMFGILRYLRSIQLKEDIAVSRITRFNQGDQISELTLPNLDGIDTSVSHLLHSNHKVLLLLLTTTCGSCEALVRQLAELARRKGGLQAIGWSVALICYGSPHAVEQLTKEVEHSEDITILVDEQATAARQYLVSSLPIGIALNDKGHLLSQSPNPGPNWLYLTLDIPAPDHSLLSGVTTAEIRFPGM